MNNIVKSGQFRVNQIDQKFLIPGHTYLPCDQDFGLIEKEKKFYKMIYVPADWAKVVQQACKKKPFIVHEMTSDQFLQTKSLLSQITNRKKSVLGGKVSWRKMVHIQAKESRYLTMLYKTTFDEKEEFSSIDLKKRKPPPMAPLSLLYPHGREVNSFKIKDIRELMAFIPPIQFTHRVAKTKTDDGVTKHQAYSKRLNIKTVIFED